MKLTENRGLKEPLFSTEEGFGVVIWRPSAVKDGEQARVQVREQVGVQVTEQLANQNIKYIEIKELPHRLVWLLKGKRSRTEIMAFLELNGRRNFIENYLTPALENGWIEMTNPKSPNSPKQKYRLTKKGNRLKKVLAIELE